MTLGQDINEKADPEYIERLQMAIQHLHRCDAEHVDTVRIYETFRGSPVWEGKVEVFSVSGHARAKRCYAWGDHQGRADERYTAILELPPVKSALDAVKVSIIASVNRQGSGGG
jgi:hypothetical protein